MRAITVKRMKRHTANDLYGLDTEGIGVDLTNAILRVLWCVEALKPVDNK